MFVLGTACWAIPFITTRITSHFRHDGQIKQVFYELALSIYYLLFYRTRLDYEKFDLQNFPFVFSKILGVLLAFEIAASVKNVAKCA